MHDGDRILPEFDNTDDGDSSEEENDNEMTDVFPSCAGPRALSHRFFVSVGLRRHAWNHITN